MQPFHEGHQYLLSKIFKENQEVIICIGSAQRIDEKDPKISQNPLSADERMIRLESYLKDRRSDKPFRIISVPDIDSDEEWPEYLRRISGINTEDRNRIYFGDRIDAAYETGLRAAGFEAVIVKRKSFKHETPDHKTYEVVCATEIRALYKKNGYEI